MDDQVHAELDFHCEFEKEGLGLVPKQDKSHSHSHGSIEEAIEFLQKEARQDAEIVDKEEGNDKTEDESKKNLVQKSCEEQIKRILSAYPESKNDQAHHLDLLHKVIHAQKVVDIDKHQGETHHHKKKHIHHFELLTKTYADSFTK